MKWSHGFILGRVETLDAKFIYNISVWPHKVEPFLELLVQWTEPREELLDLYDRLLRCCVKGRDGGGDDVVLGRPL